MNTTNQSDFFQLSSQAARKRITADIQWTIMWKNPFLRTLAIQNKEWFRETYYRARSGAVIDLFALVSPTYTNDQKLSDDPKYFTRPSQWLEARVPKKFNASVEAMRLLKKYFTFRTNIVIADTGLLLSEEYVRSQDITEAIKKTESMYSKRASELLEETDINTTKLSSLLWQSPRVVKMDFVPTRKDCEDIIRTNAVNPERLLKNLTILIKAFGITVAYYELIAYFEESRLMGEALGRSLILNIEWTSVGNKLLTKWIWNLCTDRPSSAENWFERKWWNLLVGGTVTLN